MDVKEDTDMGLLLLYCVSGHFLLQILHNKKNKMKPLPLLIYKFYYNDNYLFRYNQ